MLSMAEIIEFCQLQAEFHRKQAARLSKSSPEKTSRHVGLEGKFRGVVDSLQTQPPAPSNSAEADLFAIDPYDVGGLPAELVEQLSIPKSDDDEVKLIQLLRLATRPLSINEIMVGLYRKFGDLHKRNSVNARLYRLSKKGELESPQTGFYKIAERRGTGDLPLPNLPPLPPDEDER
jgi:hypothetical protein